MPIIETADFLVVGGGIVGLTIAAELQHRHERARVVVLEKESVCGGHASGRNSGVLHAGFYYTKDSLKARFSRDGNHELTTYCLSRGLSINRCGKLVVPRCEEEIPLLDQLARRAEANGVEVERLGPGDTARLEPQIRPGSESLYSPSTATVDPQQVVASLARDAEAAGVRIETGVAYRRFHRGRVVTSRGDLAVGYVVNAAGLYADRVARDFGFSASHRILPFRGLYLDYKGRGPVPRVHIYPVPRLDHPFLGVHWTITVDGRVKIGPTATPALWREHYKGLSNLRLGDLLEVGRREADLLLRDSFGFRRLAWSEVKKYRRRRLVEQARELVRDSTGAGAWQWGSVGVRAQLLNIQSRALEMDFCVEGDDRSFHILNAVSPAFTCALPFSRYVANEIDQRFGSAASEMEPSTSRAEVVGQEHEWPLH